MSRKQENLKMKRLSGLDKGKETIRNGCVSGKISTEKKSADVQIHRNGTLPSDSKMDVREDWSSIAMDRLSDDESFITARIVQLDELLLKLSRDRDEFLQRVDRAEQDIVDSAERLHHRVESDKNRLLDVIRETEGTYRQVYEKSRTDIERSIERMKDFQISSAGLRAASCDDAITLEALHNKRNKLDMIRHNIIRSTLKFTPTNTQDTILASRSSENLIGSVTFKEAIDHFDRYLSTPTLIQTIPGTVSILGIAKINNELYVLRCTSIEAAAHVQVFSIKDFGSSFSSLSSFNPSTSVQSPDTPNLTPSHSVSDYAELRRFGFKQLRDPKDLAAGRHVLYLSDFGGRVLVSDPSGNLLSVWEVGGQPRGISITSKDHLLVTCSKTRMVKEYSQDGQCVTSISFQPDIINPLHTVELPAGMFAVCHGWTDNLTHRVCVVDSCGRLVHSYGGMKGSGPGKVDLPFRLAVDQSGNVLVVDRNNHRIQQLSPTMVHVRDLISREGQGLEAPRRFMLDSSGMLYLGLNDGRVLVYKIMA